MTTLFDLSVGTYGRVLQSSIAIMEKGAGFYTEQGNDVNDILDMQLAPDMAPFPFQVNSVRHHTLGAVKGMLAGEFSPPGDLPELDYQGLIGLLREALAEIEAVDAESIAATEGKAVLFKAEKFELPFTTENFILSFSLPNLYFHATTLYDMLRIKGVPLGKIDFMGKMKLGLPE